MSIAMVRAFLKIETNKASSPTLNYCIVCMYVQVTSKDYYMYVELNHVFS